MISFIPGFSISFNKSVESELKKLTAPSFFETRTFILSVVKTQKSAVSDFENAVFPGFFLTVKEPLRGFLDLEQRTVEGE